MPMRRCLATPLENPHSFPIRISCEPIPSRREGTFHDMQLFMPSPMQRRNKPLLIAAIILVPTLLVSFFFVFNLYLKPSFQVCPKKCQGADYRGQTLLGQSFKGFDLSHANMPNSLASEVDFRGANLYFANLSHADLKGADFSGADLSGTLLTHADLRNAKLTGSRLDGARLYGADLRNADLRGTIMGSADLTRALLKGSIIDEKTVMNGHWERIWHLVNDPEPNLDLEGTSLSRANLEGFDFGQANLRFVRLQDTDLSGANLSQADLEMADLRQSSIDENTLFTLHDRLVWELHNEPEVGRDYTGVEVTNSMLSGVFLQDANLQNAVFRGSILTFANLRNSDLRGADFSKADLTEADLDRAVLSGTILSGANLHGAEMGLSNLRGTIIDSETILPERWHIVWTILNKGGENGNYSDLFLGWADLAGANLQNADFTGSDLRYSTLAGADLRNADFTNAVLTSVDFSDTLLEGTVFTGADLANALGPVPQEK